MKHSAAYPYYVEHVRRYLIKKYGSEVLYQGGLKVYLAMDLNFQTNAHEALRKGILELTKLFIIGLCSHNTIIQSLLQKKL